MPRERDASHDRAIAEMMVAGKNSVEISAELARRNIEIDPRQVRRILERPEVQAIALNLSTQYASTLEAEVKRLERQCQKLSESRTHTITATIANGHATNQIEWAASIAPMAQQALADIISGEIPASGATRGTLAWNVIKLLVDSGSSQEESTIQRGLSKESVRVFVEDILGVRPPDDEETADS